MSQDREGDVIMFIKGHTDLKNLYEEYMTIKPADKEIEYIVVKPERNLKKREVVQDGGQDRQSR